MSDILVTIKKHYTVWIVATKILHQMHDKAL